MAKKKKKLAPCGTLARYKTCKCARCKAANAAHQRAYQQKLRDEGAGPRKTVVVESTTHDRLTRRCRREKISMRKWVDKALREALR